MSALNIRDIGTERKRALDSLSSASGIPVAELVRRFIDEGLRAKSGDHERWLKEAVPALEWQRKHFERKGFLIPEEFRAPWPGEGQEAG